MNVSKPQCGPNVQQKATPSTQQNDSKQTLPKLRESAAKTIEKSVSGKGQASNIRTSEGLKGMLEPSVSVKAIDLKSCINDKLAQLKADSRRYEAESKKCDAQLKELKKGSTPAEERSFAKNKTVLQKQKAFYDRQIKKINEQKELWELLLKVCASGASDATIVNLIEKLADRKLDVKGLEKELNKVAREEAVNTEFLKRNVAKSKELKDSEDNFRPVLQEVQNLDITKKFQQRALYIKTALSEGVDKYGQHIKREPNAIWDVIYNNLPEDFDDCVEESIGDWEAPIISVETEKKERLPDTVLHDLLNSVGASKWNGIYEGFHEDDWQLVNPDKATVDATLNAMLVEIQADNQTLFAGHVLSVSSVKDMAQNNQDLLEELVVKVIDYMAAPNNWEVEIGATNYALADLFLSKEQMYKEITNKDESIEWVAESFANVWEDAEFAPSAESKKQAAQAFIRMCSANNYPGLTDILVTEFDAALNSNEVERYKNKFTIVNVLKDSLKFVANLIFATEQAAANWPDATPTLSDAKARALIKEFFITMELDTGSFEMDAAAKSVAQRLLKSDSKEHVISKEEQIAVLVSTIGRGPKYIEHLVDLDRRVLVSELLEQQPSLSTDELQKRIATIIKENVSSDGEFNLDEAVIVFHREILAEKSEIDKVNSLVELLKFDSRKLQRLVTPMAATPQAPENKSYFEMLSNTLDTSLDTSGALNQLQPATLLPDAIEIPMLETLERPSVKKAHEKRVPARQVYDMPFLVSGKRPAEGAFKFHLRAAQQTTGTSPQPVEKIQQKNIQFADEIFTDRENIQKHQEAVRELAKKLLMRRDNSLQDLPKDRREWIKAALNEMGLMVDKWTINRLDNRCYETELEKIVNAINEVISEL